MSRRLCSFERMPVQGGRGHEIGRWRSKQHGLLLQHIGVGAEAGPGEVAGGHEWKGEEREVGEGGTARTVVNVRGREVVRPGVLLVSSPVMMLVLPTLKEGGGALRVVVRLLGMMVAAGRGEVPVVAPPPGGGSGA